MRASVVALVVSDALLLAAASVSAFTIDPFVSRVEARPWPARVRPTEPWSATLAGSGARVTMSSVAGTVPDALDAATFRLPAGGGDPRNLTLPDGTAWRPEGGFRLEATGPLAFTSGRAREDSVELGTESLPAVLGLAHGPITAVGTFTGPAGQRVDRLPLPSTARIGVDCGRPPCPDPSVGPVASLRARPGTALRAQPGTALRAQPGTAIRAQPGPAAGEVAVAGTARAEALGRTWDGLVGALEGTGLEGTATWDGRRWSVSARAGVARQVWVDVWPVADTMVSATSDYRRRPNDACLRDCSVRLRWANNGFATSQILEAEGIGPGSGSVRFGLAGSQGHDAGLGIHRGGSTRHLRSGGDIEPTLAPLKTEERGLTTRPGSDVTLVLRGNFPEVRVPLAIPPA